MHSSRMHTAHSSSLHGGSPHLNQSRHPPEQAPQPRSPSTSPLAVGLDHIPLNFPLGCGPGDPPTPSLWPDPPKLPPWLWAWKPARHAGTTHPPMETCCKACWDTTCNACWDSTHTPPWTDTPVKTTFAKLRCHGI